MDLIPLFLAASVAMQPTHNFTGALKSQSGICIGTIKGSQTCAQCYGWIQQSLAECPGASAPPTCGGCP